MSKAVLITGGNLGSVAENLEAAREAISREVGVVERCSSVLESEAWGFEAEERFLNQVLVVATALPPEQLLERCLQIERQLGRVRRPGPRYGSRTMDIDLLFYDNRVVDSDRLTIPHPRIAERDFVLAPLEEVLPDYVHPVLKKTIRQLRRELLQAAGRGRHEKLTKNHYLCFLFSD